MIKTGRSMNESNNVSNDLPNKVDNFLQDFAQMHGGITYNDIIELGKRWNSVLSKQIANGVTKKINFISKSLKDTGMDFDELLSSDKKFKSTCDDLVTSIKNIIKSFKLNESVSLEDIIDAKFSASFMNDRAEVTIDGKSYIKIGKNKWQYSPTQASAIGGTYTDQQLFDLFKKGRDSELNESVLNEKVYSESDAFRHSDKVQEGDKITLEMEIAEYNIKIGDFIRIGPFTGKVTKSSNGEVTLAVEGNSNNLKDED